MRQRWRNWSVEDSLLICLDRFCIWAWISSSLWWMMSISICMMRHCHVYTSFSSRPSSWRTLPPSARKPICNHATTALERVLKDAEGHSPQHQSKTISTVKNWVNQFDRSKTNLPVIRKQRDKKKRSNHTKGYKKIILNKFICCCLEFFLHQKWAWHPWVCPNEHIGKIPSNKI